MAWVVNKQSTQEELANRFRALVEANEILQIRVLMTQWQL